MFRMIEGLEQAGHRCVIYLYDRFDGDPASHEAAIRSSWARVRAEVRPLDSQIRDVDACFATSWQTAHVLARRSETWPCRRLYLVQDFEPFFYPRGSEYRAGGGHVPVWVPHGDDRPHGSSTGDRDGRRHV